MKRKILATERPSADHVDLDTYPVEQLVAALAADQARAALAVQRAGVDLARAVAGAVPRIKAGGRLIYVGAGTSGGSACLIVSSFILPLPGRPSARSHCWPAGPVRCIARSKAPRTTPSRAQPTSCDWRLRRTMWSS